MSRPSALVLALLLSAPAWARPPKPPKREPPRIRRVRVIRRDVFDTKIPSENKSIFRMVNALHVTTKESAVRDELLLKEGDPYNADLAKESERALRSVLQLRNVKVVPVPVNRKTVDLLVTVQETWTTEPVFGVTGVGDNLNVKAGIREENLFGYGKQASYFYRKVSGVISRTFSYHDPHVMRSPILLDAAYQDLEDGTLRSISFAKPFQASITPWSASGGYTDDKHVTKKLDEQGKEVDRFSSETKSMSGAIGLSAGSTTRRVQRPSFGYTLLKQGLFTTAPSRAPLHEDEYHIFQAGLAWEKVRFLTVNHIKQYDREEDFALGPSVAANVGLARQDWVRRSRNANFLSASWRRGTTFGPSHFGLASVQGDGKFQRERWRASTVKTNLEYYDHFQPRQTLGCHLAMAAIVNPGEGDQLVLGGDTGMRGYRINQFAGNKLLLANLENRFFIVDDVARFMSVGAVVFADAGNVWAAGRVIRFNDIKLDVGTGLRFYLTRTSNGHVLRCDLAYAVKRVPDQKRLVFTFGTSHAF